MKMMSLLRWTLLGLVSFLAAGCTSVDEGPALPPDPNARNEIRGELPQPAPIPQKDVPPGESSLRRTRAN